jgi:hypothetical protein
MLTKFARPFILLGEEIADARTVYQMCEGRDPGDPEAKLDTKEKEHVERCFKKILALCDDLNLEVSKELFSDKVGDVPTTFREYEILISALYAEIKNKLFVFVPSHRRKFMSPRNFMSEATKKAFPEARKEMMEAGRCHAVGVYTAAVFHCTRAVEIGLRVMGTALGVTFPIPLEQVEQDNIISQIESKIRAIKDQPKSATKDADLNFYSQAAMQFRYFKDGWRVRVAHARASYDEPQALGVIEHAASFLDALATRLKEPGI